MLIKNLEEMIGNTPILEVEDGIFAKLEMFNPSGSIKVRIAKRMLDEATKQGLINKDTVIIEPTSGNTGIGLAFIASLRGLKTILVMPNTMSKERMMLLKAYGATLFLTDGKLGMQGSLDKVEELKKEYPNYFVPSQFENKENPNAHYINTAKEIYKDLNGKIDCFVAGVGTGGTLSGVGKYLKEMNPNIHIVAVEPASSPLLSEGKAGPHRIQGIGANFVPNTLDRSIYNEIITVTNEDAINETVSLAKKGYLVGISSGSNMFAAKQLSKKYKNVVTIFVDSGERYLSSGIFGGEE